MIVVFRALLPFHVKVAVQAHEIAEDLKVGNKLRPCNGLSMSLKETT